MKPEDLKAVLAAAKQRKQRADAASPAEAMLEGWSNSDRVGGLVKTLRGGVKANIFLIIFVRDPHSDLVSTHSMTTTRIRPFH